MDWPKAARKIIRDILNNKVPKVKAEKEVESINKGVFVTLYKGDDLRGCMGVPEPGPVIDNLVQACSYVINDPRFPPLQKEELKHVTIEVSLLTPSIKLDRTNLTNEEILEKIKGHGVIIRNDGLSALFLPQVWEELKDPEEFMRELCFKAGMHGDCWKDKDTEIYLFDAEIYKEQG